jgi:large subunit ribosomal protein L24e
MVVRTDICAFSEQKIYPGRGNRIISRDGRLFFLSGSKTDALFTRKVKGQDVRWSIIWRRVNKKIKTDDTNKRKKRRNKKVVRDIQGLAREEIRRRQGETKEEKAAQNEKAVRELKERKARANAAKKTVGKTAAPTQAKPQAKNPKKR